jgi:hypothetical protein
MSITQHAHSKTFLAVQAALTALALAAPVAGVVSDAAAVTATVSTGTALSEGSFYGTSGAAPWSAYCAVSSNSCYDPITGNSAGGVYIPGGSAASAGASASSNTITIEGMPSGQYSVVGGGVMSAGNVAVTGNTVTIKSGAIVSGTVVGGFQGVSSGTSAVSGNKVIMQGGSVKKGTVAGGDVVGAIAYGSGNAVTQNTVTINGGFVENDVIGGWARSDGSTATTSNVTSNTVTISGGEIGGNVIGGWIENTKGTASVEKNEVNITGSAEVNIGGNVYGGRVLTSTGNAFGNKVTIAVSGGGTIGGDIIGGWVEGSSGAAGSSGVGNVVSIVNNGGAALMLEGKVYGGKADSGNAVYNQVTITGSGNNVTQANSAGDELFIYGGYTTSGSATNNTVTLGGNFVQTSGTVYGGYSVSGAAASANTVIIEGNAQVANAYGGGGGGTGNFTSNTLTKKTEASVIAGKAGAFATVGFEYSGDANIGTLETYSTSTTTLHVDKTSGVTNTIEFGGVITGSGGIAKTGAGTLVLEGANTYLNSTVISGGALIVTGTLDSDKDADNGEYVYSGGIAITSASHSLTFDQSEDQKLTGAITGSGALNVTGTGILTLTGANSGGYGGKITVSDGGTLAIEGDQNLGSATTLGANTLAGGTLVLLGNGGTGSAYEKDWLISGVNTIKATKDETTLGSAGAGSSGTDLKFGTDGGELIFAGGKQITVYATIRNDKDGNLTIADDDTKVILANSHSESYKYTGTTTVGEDATLELAAKVALLDGGELLLKEGATFEVSDGDGTPADKATYDLGANAQRNGKANGHVTVENQAALLGPVNANKATFTFVLNKPALANEYSDTNPVLEISDDGQFNDVKTEFITTYDVGDVLDYLIGGDGVSADAIKAWLKDVPVPAGLLANYKLTDSGWIAEATEESKAVSEGFLGGIGLLNLGGDLVTDKGLTNAAQSVARSGGAGEAFAALGGGKVKHKTGSHVDVSGVSLVAGVAAGVGNGATVGAFVEYGDGDYDSSNSFSSGKVKGSGDTEYVGVGFLGRYDLPKTASGQPYLEATARFGQVKSDFKVSEANAKYDVKSNYHGLSFGGGHVWNVGANGALDLYGRYVWTRQASDTANFVSPNFDEKVKFSAVDSHRTRLGVRYSTAWSGSNRFYAGAAWEHEFDGEASAKVVTKRGSAKIDAPEMKGSTGIVEFGLVFNPADNKNLSIDVGIQGYGGKRQGATGSAQLKYKF